MTDGSWYFAKDNQQQGPVDQAFLCSLFSTQKLPLDTLVWTAGLADWQPASQIEMFAQAAQQDEASACPPPQQPEQQSTAQLPQEQPTSPWALAPAAASAQPGLAAAPHPYDKETGERPSLSEYTAGFEVNPEPFRFEQTAIEPQSLPEPAQGQPAATAPAPANPWAAGEPQAPPYSAQPYESSFQTQSPPQAMADAAVAPNPFFAPIGQMQPGAGVAMPGNVAQENTRGPKFVSGIYLSVEDLDAIPTPAARQAPAQPTAAPPTVGQRLPAAPLRSRQKPTDPPAAGAARKVPPKRLVDPTSSSTHKAVPAEVGIFSGLSQLAFTQALRRFGARTIDTMLFALPGALVYFIVVYLVGLKMHDPRAAELAACFCPLLLTLSCLALEITVLSVCGTTPGKKLLGIRLAPVNGDPPLGPAKSCLRTAWLYVYIGWAFLWIPFLFEPLLPPLGAHVATFVGNLVVFGLTAFQFHRFMNTGITGYDKRAAISCRFLW